MPHFIKVVFATLSAPLIVFVTWLWARYLERRVSEAARGAVDVTVGKTLAEHRLSIDQQLERYRAELGRDLEGLRQTLALDRERYARDYGLFATTRNEVYAETFSLLEHARGGYGARFAWLTSRTDFSRSAEVDLRHWAEGLKFISESERVQQISLLESDDLNEARKMAAELEERASLRQANSAFEKFKNGLVLNALYFSERVDPLLTEALREFASLSVTADLMLQGQPVDLREASRQVHKVDEITARVRAAMKEDMQASFSAASITPASASQSDS